MKIKAVFLGLGLIISASAALGVNVSEQADRSNVSVGVAPSCDIDIKTFEAPNNGFLGRNSTGVFQASMLNNGSYSNNTLNASLEINHLEDVTNETLRSPDALNLSNISNRYSENISSKSKTYIDDLADPNGTTEYNFSALSNSTKIFIDTLEVRREINLSLVQNQTANFSIKRDLDNFTRDVGLDAANRRAQYIKFFYAAPEYPLGAYEATLNIDYRCLAFDPSSGRQTRPISKQDNKTIDFSIVEASGGVNDSANQSSNQTVPQDVNRTGEESDQQIQGNNQNPGQT